MVLFVCWLVLKETRLLNYSLELGAEWSFAAPLTLTMASLVSTFCATRAKTSIDGLKRLIIKSDLEDHVICNPNSDRDGTLCKMLIKTKCKGLQIS